MREDRSVLERATATLGGGCFWCIEAVYHELRGVNDAVSGYSGGNAPNPTYEQVCTGITGHAEVVQITFDPQQISYRDVLEIFFSIHDPTTLNRQGSDVGSQYRSVVFYHDEEQRAVAEKVISEKSIAQLWSNPIVTEVRPFKDFYRAEDYHQKFYSHNLSHPYCRAIVSPKVVKFRKKHLARLRN